MSLQSSIKPELLQCYIELNTKVCQDVAEVESDLADKLQVVRRDRAAVTTCVFSGGEPIRFRRGRTRMSQPTSATTA